MLFSLRSRGSPHLISVKNTRRTIMELTVTHHEGYVVAQTTGPIDRSAGDLFREYLHPLIGQGGTRVVVDLSGSPRINSDGVSMLTLLVADANTNGSHVVFAAPSPFVQNVFSVTRLIAFFDVEDNLSAAVENVMREI